MITYQRLKTTTRESAAFLKRQLVVSLWNISYSADLFCLLRHYWRHVHWSINLSETQKSQNTRELYSLTGIGQPLCSESILQRVVALYEYRVAVQSIQPTYNDIPQFPQNKRAKINTNHLVSLHHIPKPIQPISKRPSALSVSQLIYRMTSSSCVVCL